MARPKGSKDKNRRIKSSPKSLEMVGKKYFRWTLLELIPQYKNNKFKVRCECGKEGIVAYSSLITGKSKSCGCYHREEMSKRQIKPNLESAKRKLYNNYKAYNRLFQNV